jgi:ribonuclease Y
MLTVAAVLVGVLLGAVGAAAILLARSSSRVRTAEAERARMLGDAEREAEAVRREAQVEAREQAVHLRADIEAEVADRRSQIVKIEERVLQKEEEIDEKLTELIRREQGLGDR